ncbi:adenylate kinase family protein [Candidatus Micrarchaeota archaeon]|nr:adenylate kinase family protein [Candidatus Micrarchaeota archaeon]
MRIVLTGVPGTGKTTVCKNLARRIKHRCISLNSIIERYHVYFYIDKKDGSKVVDMKKLSDYVTNMLAGEDRYIVEGHLACEFFIPADLVIVLRTHPRILEKRLKKRRYNKQKVKDNVVCELIDYCVIKSENVYNKQNVPVVEVNTTNKSVEKVVSEILEIIKGVRKPKHIDWSSRMFRSNVDFIRQLENL